MVYIVLILWLLVSNLILVYRLIVASRSYVEKLAPVAQYLVLKCWTVLALKYYYHYHSKNTRSYIGLNTCSTVLLNHTIAHCFHFLQY